MGVIIAFVFNYVELCFLLAWWKLTFLCGELLKSDVNEISSRLFTFISILLNFLVTLFLVSYDSSFSIKLNYKWEAFGV